MAFTIIEVEKITGISSHTLRFWAKKGLFPFIQRDKNGVKYFSKNDIEWAKWILWLRKANMSLEDIRLYAIMLSRGFSSAQERKRLLETQYAKLLNHIKELKSIAKHLEYKIDVYDKSIKSGIDLFNTQSKDYKVCKQIYSDN